MSHPRRHPTPVRVSVDLRTLATTCARLRATPSQPLHRDALALLVSIAHAAGIDPRLYASDPDTALHQIRLACGAPTPLGRLMALQAENARLRSALAEAQGATHV